MHGEMHMDIYVKKRIPEKQEKHFRCTGAKRESRRAGHLTSRGPLSADRDLSGDF
jgi:hypothetical protein